MSGRDLDLGRIMSGSGGSGGSVSALDWKRAVFGATTAALPAYTQVGNVLTMNANGTIVADGQIWLTGKRVLVKNEAGAAQAFHGIYDVTYQGDGSRPAILTRSSDANADAYVTNGLAVWVEGGTVNGKSGWLLTTADPIVLNTTQLAFEKVLDIVDTAPTAGTVVERDSAAFVKAAGIDSGAASGVTIRRNGSYLVAFDLSAAEAQMTSNGSTTTGLAFNHQGTGIKIQSSGQTYITANKASAVATVATDGTNATDFTLSATNNLKLLATNAPLALWAAQYDFKSAGGTTTGSWSIVGAGACGWQTAQDTTWIFSQAGRTSDAATKDFTWRTQAPFATATTTSRTPGAWIAALNVQSNGGGSGVEESAKFAMRWENAGSSVLRRAEWQSDRVQTTDGTAGVVCSKHAIPDATVEYLEIVTTARRASNGDCAVYVRGIGVKRHGGGSATVIGSTTLLVTAEDAGISAADVGTSGGATFIQGTVTGITATIEWAQFWRTCSMTP